MTDNGQVLGRKALWSFAQVSLKDKKKSFYYLQSNLIFLCRNYC